MLENISVNAHSSVRIAGGSVVYVDPFRITGEPHDADLILFTHPHYDHFSPEDFLNVFDFNTTATVAALGAAVSQTDERILRQVEVTIKSYEREHQTERKEKL